MSECAAGLNIGIYLFDEVELLDFAGPCEVFTTAARVHARPEVMAWIASVARGCRLVASVCTDAFLLAKAGLPDGLRVTTHRDDVAALQADFPQIGVVSGPRWLDNGTRVTSAGISAGIDMSLHLVQRLAGREPALATARQMGRDWRDADAREAP